MSLMARIRRCEAQIDWLGTHGPLRLSELQFKELEYWKLAEARLAANPRDEKARRFAAMLDIALPPLPGAAKSYPEEPPMRPSLEGCPSSSLRDTSPRDASQGEGLATSPPFHDERFRDTSFNGWTPANVVCVPPSSWPPRGGAAVEDWYEDGDP